MLARKMFRDIRFNLSQFITVFLMVFIGIMAYSGIRSYMDGMTKTADVFYEEQNLQDLEAMAPNFTDKDLEKAKKINHVNNAERRLTIVGNMDSEKDITLQLNFIEENKISEFYVVQGEGFNKEKSGLWLDEYFANKNDIKTGDTIKIKYDGETLEEKVLGLINIPDHVYDIKDESAIFPTHTDYGFVYMSINEFPESYVKKQAMQKAGIEDEKIFNMAVKDFNYKDYLTFNYLLIDVDEKENKNYVKNEIEKELKDVLAVTKAEDTLSYATYQGEIEEGETYCGVFSGLFLFIAVLSVITTMTRVVKKQRTQIGTLKALGFKNGRITMHYVGFGFWIALFGAILGLIVGPLFIGNVFINEELEYFEVPNGKAVVSTEGFIVAAATVLVITLVTYLTCRKELKENPAETLRTQMPKVKSKNLNFTTKGIFKNMSFGSKWNLRDIFRNKARTIMGIAGVTGCCMLLVCGFGMFDSMNKFLDDQFDKLYNFDYKLSIKQDYTKEQYDKLIERFGENTSQTLMIEIENGDIKDKNNIFVNNSKGYVRFVNHNGDFINLNDDGIFVTEKLADVKGYKIGDTIKWHIYGEDKYYETKIVGFDRDAQNQNVKMTKKYLESLGLEYKADSIYTNEDLSDVKEIEGVELIQDKNALKSGTANMLDTMKMMLVLLIVLAAVLGGVIIYNLGILSFTEKQYQFATLKVLGFTDKQIKKIYIKQNNWIAVISIIIGLPLGFYMTDYIFKMALSDSYDFGASIKMISYVYSAIGTWIVSYMFSKFLARKIGKIDMVTSLKGNE